MLRPCCGLPHYGQRRCYAFLDVYLKRGIGQGQAVAAGLIAIGVIGEGGVDDAARDRCDRMRERLARLGIAVIADIRFDQDVADAVVGEALGDIDADLRRRQHDCCKPYD